jgi:hypothetical protein
MTVGACMLLPTRALSAFFDGNQGGLFAQGQVDAAAQQLLLVQDCITAVVPAKELVQDPKGMAPSLLLAWRKP